MFCRYQNVCSYHMHPLEELANEDDILTNHNEACASTVRMFRSIVQFDNAGSWKRDGVTSMAHWLAYRLNYPKDDASDCVRVAHALTNLPAIEAAFEEGLFNLPQLKELVQFATPETDAELARECVGLSTAVLARRAARARMISREEVELKHAERRLSTRWRDDVLKIWGRIPGDGGALVEKVLTRLADEVPNDADGQPPTYPQRYADALVELASIRAGADKDPDRANVVVHVDARDLATGEGIGLVEGNIPVAIDTVKRLLCDGRSQTIIVAPDGKSIGVGRMMRTVPAWLLRLLIERDEGCCRFEGCARTRGLRAHHIHEWALGGPTDLDNLILLCRYHHRLMHEGGWRVRITASGRLRFVRPDGRPLANRPPPFRLSYRAKTLGPRTRAP